MTISLRQTTQADRDFLWWLHVAAMKPYVEQTWGWDDAWQRQEFDRKFDPAAVQVIELDDAPVGCVSVRRETDHVFLAAIEIDPQHQNRGVGSEVIGQIIAEADAEDLPVRLRVLKVNPARALYERLDFRCVAETETHYVMVRERSN